MPKKFNRKPAKLRQRRKPTPGWLLDTPTDNFPLWKPSERAVIDAGGTPKDVRGNVIVSSCFAPDSESKLLIRLSLTAEQTRDASQPTKKFCVRVKGRLITGDTFNQYTNHPDLDLDQAREWARKTIEDLKIGSSSMGDEGRVSKPDSLAENFEKWLDYQASNHDPSSKKRRGNGRTPDRVIVLRGVFGGYLTAEEKQTPIGQVTDEMIRDVISRAWTVGRLNFDPKYKRRKVGGSRMQQNNVRDALVSSVNMWRRRNKDPLKGIVAIDTHEDVIPTPNTPATRPGRLKMQHLPGLFAEIVTRRAAPKVFKHIITLKTKKPKINRNYHRQITTANLALLCVLSGGRISENRTLHWTPQPEGVKNAGWVDFDAGVIHYGKTKNNNNYIQPLTPAMREIFEQQQRVRRDDNRADMVFPAAGAGGKQGCLGVGALSDFFAKAFDFTAGAHDLRKLWNTTATDLNLPGAHIDYLGKWTSSAVRDARYYNANHDAIMATSVAICEAIMADAPKLGGPVPLKEAA